MTRKLVLIPLLKRKVPTEFGAEWTSRAALNTAIKQWVTAQWDKSDNATAKKPLAKSKSQVKRIAVQSKVEDKVEAEDVIKKAVKAENAAIAAANKRVAESNA